ncbi:hypothetical protein RHSIM_Rhsim09G0099300 [Rhododendron simsii]|uniref:Uncharacterized protein n=1 Tax=Rhododendron simsii TaxID=118357 RepID=A0A834LFT4_RHOSS|nr:hypothetical protein RHSIM_Rhsim09G0099300 [Rhododendron simsii]
MVKLAFGSIGESFSVGSLKAYLAEFISTLLALCVCWCWIRNGLHHLLHKKKTSLKSVYCLRIYIILGNDNFADKLTSDASLDPAGLVAVALAHAFALFVGVSMAANISGGHLNSAITFGLAIGGNITILTAIFYWIAQVLGSTVACFLLQFVTAGMVYPPKNNKKIFIKTETKHFNVYSMAPFYLRVLSWSVFFFYH